MSIVTRWSLANRGLVALLTLVVAGVAAYLTPTLQQQFLPSLTLPTVSVAAAYPGASPDIVADKVTDPIEDALGSVDDATEITSTSSDGTAGIRVSFDYGGDIDAERADVDRALATVTLPDGVDPKTSVGSTDDLPVMQLAATTTKDADALARKLDDTVAPRLRSIDGVADATVTGDRGKVVTIKPDTDALADKGLTLQSISDAVKRAGTATPAGSITAHGKTLTVQAGDSYTAVKDLEDLYLTPAADPAAAGRQRTTKEPRPVRLGDVAKVSLDDKQATSLSRTNGRDSLGVSITADPDGNAVSISRDVRDRLDDLTDTLGSGAKLTVISDRAPDITGAIDDVSTEGLLGLAMAVLVILVFLASIRSTLVTAVSIPLSVLIALIALWAQDYTLDIITLGALTIAIGRVVDDSIVVLENIRRHLSEGENRRTAVPAAVREVAGAVIASTITTVAVFLPIGFVGGIIGEVFGPFSVTVTVALLASLLVALTVVPVGAYWFMKPPKATREPDRRPPRPGLLQRGYVPILRFVTRHRLSTVAVGLLILIGTAAAVPQLKTSFLDDSGASTVNMTQTLPAGTSLEAADAKAKRVERLLRGIDAIDTYQVNVGGGGSGTRAQLRGQTSTSTDIRYALRLADGSDADAVTSELRSTLDDQSGLGAISVADGGAMGGDTLEVDVSADDADVLARASHQVADAMSDTPGVVEVSSNLSQTASRVDISVDRSAAADHGLTETDVAAAATLAVRGTTLAQLTFDDTTADVVLESGGATPTSLEDLRDIEVAKGVRLDDVADVARVDGPVSVDHVDGDRTAVVTGTNTADSLGATTKALTARLGDLDLPAGAAYAIGGASRQQSESFGDLGLAMAVAIVLVFLVMAITFRSVVQPLILLVSIPFAATGAIGLLLATDTPLGLAAGIGLLMLVGIVVTNAIVLIDLINQYRAKGMPLREAVIEGGRHRLRPILMTALATIFALTPMAIGLTGGGTFISTPLAIVVIGGLVSSTVLTLVLVPALYTMVERRREARAS